MARIWMPLVFVSLGEKEEERWSEPFLLRRTS